MKSKLLQAYEENLQKGENGDKQASFFKRRIRRRICIM